MPIEGLQELVDKLERLTDERMVKTVQRRALKDVAEMVLNQMKSVSPVSSVRNIHGIDAESIVSYSFSGGGGYKVGLTNQGGHGDDYWYQIRGLWYQNFKIDEPNYGWYTRFRDQHRAEWLRLCREHIKIAINEYLRTY